MGKVCFIYDKLLITDNDSAIQMTKTHPLACNCKPGWVSSDPKPPTPSLAIARGGGSFSFFLRQRTTTSHVGSSSSSASVCTHHNDDDNPPPRLQLRDGVDPFLLFKATNDDEPCRLVVVICLRLHPPQ